MTLHKKSLFLFGTLLVASNFVFFLLLIVLIEGTISWYHFFKELRATGSVAEELHTEYDSLLGWVNKSNFFVKDMYGPGNDLTLLPNRTRLTSSSDHQAGSSVICSGDSFTMGYGVGDLETWCSVLGKQGWKMVNMGQGGYGIDQGYLWYERDTQNIPHQLLLAAFNIYDFDRTYSSTFVGYKKPYFQVNGDAVTNVQNPVPKPSAWKRFLVKNSKALNGLYTFRSMKNLSVQTEETSDPADQQKVIDYLFQHYKQTAAERGAQLVYVALPTVYDKQDPERYLETKKMVEESAKKFNFPIIDVGEEMFKLDQSSYEGYFTHENIPNLNGSAGHYTVEGNELVASIIAQAIKDLNVPGLLTTPTASPSGTPAAADQ